MVQNGRIANSILLQWILAHAWQKYRGGTPQFFRWAAQRALTCTFVQRGITNGR